jgi:hypothetical protein
MGKNDRGGRRGENGEGQTTNGKDERGDRLVADAAGPNTTVMCVFASEDVAMMGLPLSCAPNLQVTGTDSME